MADPTFELVDIDLMQPNRYNPNVMDPEMFEKAVESIHRFGFIDPVTVREIGPHDFEIVDGEHRWKAGQDHSSACIRNRTGAYIQHVGLRQLPVFNLGLVKDSIARQLTIVLNETRGTYDPKRMGKLLIELVALEPLPELLGVLPFSKERITELAELPEVDWNKIEDHKPSSGRADRWVERVYRLPVEAAEKLDQAIGEARDGDGSDWRALQTLAEHFLGS